jgi:hypothetical protein
MTEVSASSPAPALAPSRRRRWRTWLFALFIFLGGAALGSALTAGAIFRSFRHAMMHPEEAPQRITARLKSGLDLTNEQADQVRAIITRRQQSLMQIRRDVQPRVELELDQLESEIAAVLYAGQQEVWRTLATRFRRNWLPPVPTPPASVGRLAPTSLPPEQ